MFDDSFDRDWELAILIHQQYEAVADPAELTPEQEQLFRVRSRRIGVLIERIVQELPNWQEEIVSGGTISVN